MASFLLALSDNILLLPMDMAGTHCRWLQSSQRTSSQLADLSLSYAIACDRVIAWSNRLVWHDNAIHLMCFAGIPVICLSCLLS